MMKSLALLGLLALPAMASAQTTPAPAPSAPVAEAEQRATTPLDATNFCYFEGKAYSKGARHLDQVCGTGGGLVTYSTLPGRPAPTLSWGPVSRR